MQYKLDYVRHNKPECKLQLYHQGVKFIIIIIIFSIGIATDLESAEPLGDFLCITFVVCPCVRHVHVDFFSLLLCAFLHADTCAVHVCFVHESLLFLQHLELHNFLYQTIQPDLVVLDGQQSILL